MAAQFTPENAVHYGSIGGKITASRRDPNEATKPATAGFLRRFEREADPDGNLPPEERQRRARCLLEAHMTRLRIRSWEARRVKKAVRSGSVGPA